MSRETIKPRIFYGWFIVTALFAITLTIGGANWTFGIFIEPLENEFGWSRTLVSSGYVALLIGRTISLVTAGVLVDKYHPRPVLLSAALLVGFGISLCSQVSTINQFRIFLLTAGMGIGTIWTVTTSTVSRWFYRRRRAGLALGIVIAGVGVGTLIFAPLISQLIHSYGWRNTYLIIGLLFLVLIAVSSLVVRKSPGKPGVFSEREAKVSKSIPTPGYMVRKVVTTPSFIAMLLIISTSHISGHIIAAHLVPYASSAGISATASSVAIGLLGGFTVPGRILGGYVADRIGWQKIMVLSSFGMGLSLFFLILFNATWVFYGFIFLYGTFLGSGASASIGILGEYFGAHSLGKLIGITSAAAFFTGSLASYMAGFSFDATGSYYWAFFIAAALLIGSGFAAAILKKPSN